jgi:hypothetical protein
MAGDHGGVDGPAGGLGEVLGQKIKEQLADVGEQIPVVAQEGQREKPRS